MGLRSVDSPLAPLLKYLCSPRIFRFVSEMEGLRDSTVCSVDQPSQRTAFSAFTTQYGPVRDASRHSFTRAAVNSG